MSESTLKDYTHKILQLCSRSTKKLTKKASCIPRDLFSRPGTASSAMCVPSCVGRAAVLLFDDPPCIKSMCSLKLLLQRHRSRLCSTRFTIKSGDHNTVHNTHTQAAPSACSRRLACTLKHKPACTSADWPLTHTLCNTLSLRG